MANNESFAQIQPDSTGAKVRTLETEILQEDGLTVSTVATQVAALADADGNLIDPLHKLPVATPGVESLLGAILQELTLIRQILGG